jgi:FeS assembly SUF system protein
MMDEVRDTAAAENVQPVEASLPAAEPFVETTEGGRIVPNVSSAIPSEEVARITADLIGVLKTVYDPEIPVDIYELGLIYRVDLDDDRNLAIDMTLTAPGCPVAGDMPGWVENAALSVEGIQSVTVNMVFDPPWDAERMSEEAKVALNWW